MGCYRCIGETTMKKFEDFDKDGNGNIDKAEWDALEYEDRKRRLEDEDAQRDAQRRMTWFALSGMLLYPFAVVPQAPLALAVMQAPPRALHPLKAL